MRDKLHYIICLFVFLVSCNKKLPSYCTDYHELTFVIVDGFLSEYDMQKETFKIDYIDSVQTIPLKLNKKRDR